jgi:hypothetical protein
MLFLASGRVYLCRTFKEAYNAECMVPKLKQGAGPVMVLAISWYSILLVPLLPFTAELLQGQVG